jgi:membrane protein
MEATKTSGSEAGSQADEPTEIPPRGWFAILKRSVKTSSDKQIPLLAAGVAFFAFLSLFPAMIAIILIVGLVADPATVSENVNALTQTMPSAAQELIGEQLRTLAASRQQSLGIGLVISLLIALWSASSGVGKMISAINLAYDEDETRGFVRLKLLALGLTLAAIIFTALLLGLIGVVAVLDRLPSLPLRIVLEGARWLLLVVLLAVALAVIYRVAPDRDAPKIKWVSVGAIAATVLWLLASIGFTVYVANFGSYAKTYGALAGVIILMLWLWISCFAILLGATINAESEAQTVKDSTQGEPRPLGERQATKADSVPPGE